MSVPGYRGDLQKSPVLDGPDTGNVFWLFLILAMVMRKLQRLGKLTQKAEAQAGRYAGEAFRNWACCTCV